MSNKKRNKWILAVILMLQILLLMYLTWKFGTQRLDGAAELRHQTVARRSEDAATELADRFRNQVSPLMEDSDRRFLVFVHQARKADCVDGADGGKLPDRLLINHSC